jgi:hypothetical protein
VTKGKDVVMAICDLGLGLSLLAAILMSLLIEFEKSNSWWYRSFNIGRESLLLMLLYLSSLIGLPSFSFPISHGANTKAAAL